MKRDVLDANDRRRFARTGCPPNGRRISATYLVWPHNRDTWPGKFEPIPPVFARMAAAIAHFEPLRILVEDARAMAEARAR